MLCIMTLKWPTLEQGAPGDSDVSDIENAWF